MNGGKLTRLILIFAGVQIAAALIGFPVFYILWQYGDAYNIKQYLPFMPAM
jgi:hypothetical protein